MLVPIFSCQEDQDGAKQWAVDKQGNVSSEMFPERVWRFGVYMFIYAYLSYLAVNIYMYKHMLVHIPI